MVDNRAKDFSGNSCYFPIFTIYITIYTYIINLTYIAFIYKVIDI